MERWSIEIGKEYFRFAAAHFLIFPDGSAERLHGNNYRVFVEIEAELDRFGILVDFQDIKPVVRTLLEELDECWIVPAEHPELHTHRREDGVIEIRYRDRYYAAPEMDVRILPLNNTSVENLSTYLGRELRRRLQEAFHDLAVRELRLAVQETPGQRGVYHYCFEG